MFVRCFEAVLNGYRPSGEFSISIVGTCIRLTLGELSDDKDGVKNGTPNAVVLKVITTSLLAGCTNSCVQCLVPFQLQAVKI
jgi:hypothetical protein